MHACLFSLGCTVKLPLVSLIGTQSCVYSAKKYSQVSIFSRLFLWDHRIELGIISLYLNKKGMASVSSSRFRHCIEKLMIHSSLEWVSGCKVRSSGKCKLHCAIRWHRRVRLQRQQRQRRQLHIVMHEAVSATAAPYQCPLPLRPPSVFAPTHRADAVDSTWP